MNSPCRSFCSGAFHIHYEGSYNNRDSLNIELQSEREKSLGIKPEQLKLK